MVRLVIVACRRHVCCPLVVPSRQLIYLHDHDRVPQFLLQVRKKICGNSPCSGYFKSRTHPGLENWNMPRFFRECVNSQLGQCLQNHMIYQSPICFYDVSRPKAESPKKTKYFTWTLGKFGFFMPPYRPLCWLCVIILSICSHDTENDKQHCISRLLMLVTSDVIALFSFFFLAKINLLRNEANRYGCLFLVSQKKVCICTQLQFQNKHIQGFFWIVHATCQHLHGQFICNKNCTPSFYPNIDANTKTFNIQIYRSK